jgi:hypothetical protein
MVAVPEIVTVGLSPRVMLLAEDIVGMAVSRLRLSVIIAGVSAPGA